MVGGNATQSLQVVPAASASRPCVGCWIAADRCSSSMPIRARSTRCGRNWPGIGHRLEVWHADVTDERQTIDAVSRANERFGGLYALVHIAGGAGPKRARDIEEFQLQDWTHVIDLNLTSAFLAARAAVPLMRAAPRPHRAVLLDHRRRRERTADHGHGAAALRHGKGGIAGFHLAARQGPGGVGHHGERADARPDPGARARASAIVSTGWSRRSGRRCSPAIPAASRAAGDDIAAVVDFLLSNSAGFISGVALPVDGAYR